MQRRTVSCLQMAVSLNFLLSYVKSKSEKRKSAAHSLSVDPFQEIHDRYQASLRRLETELRNLSDGLKDSRWAVGSAVAEKLASYAPRYIKAANGLIEVFKGSLQ